VVLAVRAADTCGPYMRSARVGGKKCARSRIGRDTDNPRFPKDPGVVCYSQGTPEHQDTKQQPAVLPSTNRQSTTKARVDVAKWQGRKGRPWRRIVAQLKATDRTCWL